MGKFSFDVNKFFIALLLAFVAFQAVSWILSQYTDLPFVKGGWLFLLLMVVVFMSSLFSLGRKLGELNLKKDLFFIVFVFAGIVAAFYFMPKYFPSLFSSQSREIGEQAKFIIGSIFGG